MRDSNLFLRATAAGSLSADENGTSKDFRGGDINNVNLTYVVNVPSKAGTNPTLDVKLQGSDDDSTFYDVAAFPQITAAGQYSIKAFCKYRYRRLVFDVGGTNPVFGTVEAWVQPAGRYKS